MSDHEEEFDEVARAALVAAHNEIRGIRDENPADIRRVLRAFVAVKQVQKEASNAAPASTGWAEVDPYHVVATAIYADMTDANIDDFDPHAKGSQPMLAFGRACAALHAYSALRDSLDPEPWGETYGQRVLDELDKGDV